MILEKDAKFEKKLTGSLEFGKFSLEHLKVSKLGLWWDTFIQSRKCMSLKIYRGLTCYDSKELCKIWRGMDLSIQNWHEEFNGFWPKHSQILKICTLMGCFWPKHIMFELKQVTRSYSMTLKIDAKFEGKLTFAFNNDMRNLTNVHNSTWKSQNWDFGGVL